MSKGVRSVLKTVAMIAVPFVAAVAAPFLAPILAPVLGAGAFATGVTGAALGAGLGGITGALTGRGALSGALMGGLGGGLGAAAGLGPSLGFSPGAGGAGVLGGLGGLGAAAPMQLPGAALGATGIAGAVTPSATTMATGLLSSLASGVTPGGIANLAMTLFNKPETELSATERAALMETAQLAQTNQDLFKKRVEDALTLRGMAAPNPEQAFAEAQQATQRGLREAQRRYGGTGMDARRGALERQASIEGVRAGTAAVRGEMARGFEQTKQAMATMPTEAPGVTPAGLAVQAEDVARKRRAAAAEQQGRAVAGLFAKPPGTGNLFGSIYAQPSADQSQAPTYGDSGYGLA